MLQRQPATEMIRIDGVEAEATLTSDGKIKWRDVAGQEKCLIVEKEVLGFGVEEEGRKIRIRAFVEAGAGGICGFGGERKVRRDFELEFPAGEAEAAAAWAEKLGEYIGSLGRPRRLFILLNPFGGKKTARKIFHDEVKPLLVAAGIYHTLEETQYQLHAQELVHNLDLMKYDAIVCISGDGILVEVLNGLLRREDWESAIKTPLGIIPAGTGNGMIKSLLDSAGQICSVSNAVLMVIRGHKCALDIATVSQGHNLFFSMLMLCWGLVADVDIESEKYRWMGSARFDVYLSLRMMKLRKYNGTISFVPAPGFENYGELVDQDKLPGIDYENNTSVQQHGYNGPTISYKSSNWRSIEGPFISIWLHNVPWANNSCKPAPDAKFSDGFYDLIIIKDCPKMALLSFLLGLSDGSHAKSPYAIYVKVKAFRLEPGQLVGDPERGGIIDSDGEVLARGSGTYKSGRQDDPMTYGPININVDRGLATIFSPQ